MENTIVTKLKKIFLITIEPELRGDATYHVDAPVPIQVCRV
jgi:hypothetical protein